MVDRTVGSRNSHVVSGENTQGCDWIALNLIRRRLNLTLDPHRPGQASTISSSPAAFMHTAFMIGRGTRCVRSNLPPKISRINLLVGCEVDELVDEYHVD